MLGNICYEVCCVSAPLWLYCQGKAEDLFWAHSSLCVTLLSITSNECEKESSSHRHGRYLRPTTNPSDGTFSEHSEAETFHMTASYPGNVMVCPPPHGYNLFYTLRANPLRHPLWVESIALDRCVHLPIKGAGLV